MSFIQFNFFFFKCYIKNALLNRTKKHFFEKKNRAKSLTNCFVSYNPYL